MLSYCFGAVRFSFSDSPTPESGCQVVIHSVYQLKIFFSFSFFDGGGGETQCVSARDIFFFYFVLLEMSVIQYTVCIRYFLVKCVTARDMQEHIFMRCQSQSTRSDSQNKDYDDILNVIDKQNIF